MSGLIKYLVITASLFCGVSSYAQQTDPLLIGAILEQTRELKEVYKKRNDTQNKIIVAQSVVGASMDVVHEVEKTILNYMQNASGAVQNLHQLKEIYELVGVTIPNNLNELRKAVPNNIKGTALSALISQNYTEIATEVTALSGHVSTLVSGSRYSLGNKGDKKETGENTKQNINLLSAAERYYIAQEVVERLRNLNYRIWLLRFKVQVTSWGNLLYHIDPETWINLNYNKELSKRLVNEWNDLAK